MSFSNPYPAAAAAIDKQVVENIILDDIINHDYNPKTKIALLLYLKVMHDHIEDDEDYWAQVEGNEDWLKAQKEERYKIARAAVDAWKAKRDNCRQEEREEEEEEEDEEEDEESEEEEEEEEDFEEEYDDEEEETEESGESEESGDEESDDGSEWDSLFLLVHNMPTENDEPKATAQKRSSPRDDSPCPPPRPQPEKRQKLDPSAASKPPMVQDSGEDKPKPATRKRDLSIQQDADTPATEVPFPKRQRIDPPSVVANANDEDQDQAQEPKSSVPSEWLAPHREELQNSQLPEPLRGILGRLPVSELHLEAQAFLLGLKYFDPTDDALAKAAIDMGLRFSKTAKGSEYKIVFEHLMRHPIQAVMYNACREDEAHHILFWEKVRNVTGKEVPPERLKERRERRAKREAEAMARFNARKAAEEAKRESQMLKEKYVSQIGEASKLPLKEKVGRWLAEIVKAEKT
ncbi:hypothetical protein FLAG1_06680 [Fusarium langsethiae]|uniref:Uncharacterized protein n=1 Tax=Fusarium langsethiae TaxID=179993 RepID=A0A0M9EUY5_FUSLA|nr:hypothetical protein FLAG1_06680 [Fusarium langsethiae]GKU04262.1 unnamed protein product [Fusarium langsethiae]GKU19906.1 unnamed protein product [Fusarium langsethiae]